MFGPDDHARVFGGCTITVHKCLADLKKPDGGWAWRATYVELNDNGETTTHVSKMGTTIEKVILNVLDRAGRRV